MAQLSPYVRYQDFRDWRADNSNSHVDGTGLDAEFDRVKTVFDAILINLAVLQQEEGVTRQVGITLLDQMPKFELNL